MIFTLPFTVWVLTTFIRDLPKELEEAAIMDGATPVGHHRKVFMPLLVAGARDHGPARLHRGLERVSLRA